MNPHTRREFLGDVGRGMLITGIGPALACDLGVSSAFANEDPGSLSFGKLEPLVSLMQETPVQRLQPLLVEKLKSGTTDLRALVSAAALANARTFGGQDYVGYHVLMAIAPAYRMACELPERLRPLPVLKVLYRNTDQIQKLGGRRNEVLKPVEPTKLVEGRPGGELLQQATRSRQMEEAERIFATLNERSPQEAYDALQFPVQDHAEVHRVALAHHAWALLDVIGRERAHTMLRQSVRYCVDLERKRKAKGYPEPAIRRLLPKLLDQYDLIARPRGKREPEDAWVDRLSSTILNSSREQAVDAVAAALAEGMAPEAVGEAISLAANRLVLLDRKSRTHGDSIGVHASDAVNAWRNIARTCNHRNCVASLIVAAYYVPNTKAYWEKGGGGRYDQPPYPLESHLETLKARDREALLREAERAIRENDQGRASAAVQRYGELGYPERPVFDLMLRYAVSEDGRLHSEKYYRTVTEEFATTRPAFRWRHLVALARVTASMYGYDRKDRHGHRAPGYDQACKLLGVG